MITKEDILAITNRINDLITTYCDKYATSFDIDDAKNELRKALLVLVDSDSEDHG